MSKIIKPEEENWRCTCGILNPNEERFCDCGKRRDEETVEISIPKKSKNKRIVPY